ncbi:MAG: hypothetical protein Q8P91_03765 [bacterium]|nr:hypothetical protein [bacterium]
MSTPPIQPAPLPEQPKNKIPKKLVIASIVLLVVAIISVAFKLILKNKAVVQPTPSPTASQAPTGDLANWKTYTNTQYKYSVKYPGLFTTQVLAAGAGNMEADSSARNLFIYQSNAKEPYLERYINLEVFEIKPSYNQGIITEVSLNNQTTTKIVLPEAKFDIYTVQLNNKGFIEIYVSNDLNKKELADQILSTFKFLD